MNILLISCKDPLFDPRPLRMLRLLETIGTVFIGSLSEKNEDYLFSVKKFFLKIVQKILQVFFPNRFSKYFSFIMRPRKSFLENFDIIVCHDLILLPFAVEMKKKSKNALLIFDAREYYPLEFESSILWKIQFKRFYICLCKRYLPFCDLVLTVSHGLQRLYFENFGQKTMLFYSLPKYHKLEAIAVHPKKIKMIYHGAANPDRGIETLIEMMRSLDKRYHLTLVLVKGSGGQKYINRLKKYANGLSIDFQNPFEIKDIITRTNNFDVGLCCFPPSTKNLEYAMPNKLFEYVQARLMVVATPLFDIKNFIEKEGVGKVTKGFSAKDIREELHSISWEEIQFYKEVSSQKAKFFSEDVQKTILTTFIAHKNNE